ncbi:MAG: hypothetical protein QOE73_2440 [Verrucomicrobiota bacterium]|jgi:hypothetical protein
MSDEEKGELRLEIAHVLFIDILVRHISVIQKFLGAYRVRYLFVICGFSSAETEKVATVFLLGRAPELGVRTLFDIRFQRNRRATLRQKNSCARWMREGGCGKGGSIARLGSLVGVKYSVTISSVSGYSSCLTTPTVMELVLSQKLLPVRLQRCLSLAAFVC